MYPWGNGPPPMQMLPQMQQIPSHIPPQLQNGMTPGIGVPHQGYVHVMNTYGVPMQPPNCFSGHAIYRHPTKRHQKLTKPPIPVLIAPPPPPPPVSMYFDSSQIVQRLLRLNEERLDLFMCLFEVSSQLPHEVRIDVFMKQTLPDILQSNCKVYVQNVFMMLDVLGNGGRDQIDHFGDPRVPEVFQRIPGSAIVHRLLVLHPLSFEIIVDTRPDTIIIGHFLTLPNLRQPTGTVSVDGIDVNPVNFGEYDTFYTISSGLCKQERIMIGVSCARNDGLVWFVLQTVSVKSTLARDLCQKCGFIMEDGQQALVRSIQCPRCEPFDLTSFLTKTASTGICECPRCCTRITIAELLIDSVGVFGRMRSAQTGAFMRQMQQPMGIPPSWSPAPVAVVQMTSNPVKITRSRHHVNVDGKSCPKKVENRAKSQVKQRIDDISDSVPKPSARKGNRVPATVVSESTRTAPVSVARPVVAQLQQKYEPIVVAQETIEETSMNGKMAMLYCSTSKVYKEGADLADLVFGGDCVAVDHIYDTGHDTTSADAYFELLDDL